MSGPSALCSEGAPNNWRRAVARVDYYLSSRRTRLRRWLRTARATTGGFPRRARRAVALAVLRTVFLSLDKPSMGKEPEAEGFARPTGRRRPCGAPAQASRVSGDTAVSENKSNPASQICSLPTWWSWRGDCTRSHPEHGRETPMRQWYCVSRRGRVGHRQVRKKQK